MNSQSISIILIALWLSSCSSIKTAEYFKIHENQIETYDGYFIKNPNDSIYRRMEQLFGSISESDTVINQTQIIYKTVHIDGHKAFYAVETVDTLQKNPNIGPRHFLFSSLIFYNDTIYMAPVYSMADLHQLSFKDFKYKIPPRLTRKDSVMVVDGRKTLMLENFSKSTLFLNNRKFSDCLTFDIREIWPNTTYNGKVWLHKQYGLLKWIRSTGRVETREL